MTSTFPVRVALTLLLALAGALVCVWLRTPIPWMMGPLLVTSLASVLGRPTRSFSLFRNAGQWIIGCAVGLYFTPAVISLVSGLWWAIALTIAWALGVGWGLGLWLARTNGAFMGGTPDQQLATGCFSGAIGGASEMTLLAERVGARADLVAAAHSVRLLIVTLSVPFALSLSGVHGLDATLPGPRVVHYPGLLLLLAVTGGGAYLMQLTGRANPWFTGPLMIAMGLTLAGVEWSSMPQWLTNCAQLVIGVSLGVRFSPAFVRTAPRWLAMSALSSAITSSGT